MKEHDIPACIYGPPEMLFRRRHKADKELAGRKAIRVAAAVLIDKGRVLAAQRGYGNYKGWWEFPGGKIEEGETPEETLRRELQEEMDAEVVIDRQLTVVDYDYPEFHITMYCLLCHFASARYTLKEHLDARWLAATDLYSVRWLPADKEPLQMLEGLLCGEERELP